MKVLENVSLDKNTGQLLVMAYKIIDITASEPAYTTSVYNWHHPLEWMTQALVTQISVKKIKV